MITRGMMTSETPEWATPTDFFKELDDIYHFDVDVCANEGNAKVDKYYSREIDGLAQEWAPHTCWMNPPYGREIITWMKKAHEESLKGATVVCLVPARTDTKWWHEYVMPHYPQGVTFVRGRLHFNDSKAGAPFPSAVITMRPPDGADHA